MEFRLAELHVFSLFKQMRWFLANAFFLSKKYIKTI